MLNYTTKYFEALLAESRAECLKYSIPGKDEILAILEANGEVFRRRDQEARRIQLMKKSHAPKEEVDAAEKEFKQLKDESYRRQDEVTMPALVPFVTNDIRLDLEPESLHVHLMICSIISQQGPQDMADFCQIHGDQYAKDLLENEDVMREMLLNGGAKNGKFLQAYKLFDELMELMEEDESMASDCHRRVAMGTALELATPINIFDSKTDFVDPKQRCLHYVKAHMNGELDPSFPYFTTWEYRHIVNCDASDEELQWGRDQLKRYYPAFLNTTDSKMTYCQQVRTDVGYRDPDWGPGQRTYRKLLSGGGKCGPRAWMGTFLCKAFGIPTWGVRQPGHAALARWTPDRGWDTCFGACISASYWENRVGDDFKYEAHARHFQKDLDIYFKRMTLLECMAVANNEPGLSLDPRFIVPTFWRSLVYAQRRYWCLEAEKMKGCFERGPPPGEEPEDCEISRYIARTDNPRDDNQIEIQGGTIRIPPCAFPKRDGFDIKRCFSGGAQANFRGGVTGFLECTLPESIPRKDYQLRFKICNVHLSHESTLFCISVNNVAACEAPILYTAGDWMYTNPVTIGVGGGDVITITRKAINNVQLWGLALREVVFEST